MLVVRRSRKEESWDAIELREVEDVVPNADRLDRSCSCWQDGTSRIGTVDGGSGIDQGAVL
jgi:hypothetical protein